MASQPDNVIPMVSRGPKKGPNGSGDIVDHGHLGKNGKLKYEVYKRGSIHIFNDKCMFKKDCDIFEDELDKLDLNNMRAGETQIIQGSGDNDNLVFKCDGDDIDITLERRGYSMVDKLKGILTRGKRKKAVG